ncbi:hypothetical protein [Desulfotalea psychrophila]|uniref:Outer membrane chaperone Skp (OmpH) n=1 Tax=Desulfotalea psychrophila (strain LSv54 / DSM 12343) TaxID=177439 RepID=Q6AN22_DESPS|nr:hypothetical protein [Desulfotalea psychrophila]CAG36252.1 unknown protein [Desulfotalea psychrophila LSv54]
MCLGRKSMGVLGLFMAVLFLCACNPVSAEKKKEEAKTKVENPQQVEQKLVKVSTLDSVEANKEFQKNVQVMQLQRQRVIQLQNQLKQTQTKELKMSLQKEIEVAMKKLNEDNKKMIETYGFSLNRNYVLVVEKAHVYMAVSDEENKKIVAEHKQSKKKK